VITDAALDAAIQTEAQWVWALMADERLNCMSTEQVKEALRAIGRACASAALEEAAQELLRRRAPIGVVHHTEWERASAAIDAIRALK
jgi:hypothetical protein